MTNREIDLGKLTKTSGNYVVNASGYSYLLNVCEDLHLSPDQGECTGMAACQVKGSQVIVAGKNRSTCTLNTVYVLIEAQSMNARVLVHVSINFNNKE